jgi:DNA-binding XRE family transcriptional regulator
VYSAIIAALIYLVRAVKKYIASKDVHNEKSETRKSLGEVIKKHRTEKKMTQEFVAETLGVSRQAVSKWESGITDPSTSNLIALAKLLEIEPEDLLREVQS